MARRLFIVNDRLPWLYEYLIGRFADDPNVTVIRDRRLGQRRRVGGHSLLTSERRLRDRRARQNLDADLETDSYVMVDLD